MTVTIAQQVNFINHDPDRFVFWTPPPGATVHTGAADHPVSLPLIPLPLHRAKGSGDEPTDDAIGQGVYDYLRQFPDCQGNSAYAALLRDAYPHCLDDLASHAVMLDAKRVEPAYVFRKLTALKILCLLEPDNAGLLLQLGRGFFELAHEFVELPRFARHLRESLRYGQELLARNPESPEALALLAEIDLLLGDTPAGEAKWRRLAAISPQPERDADFQRRCALCTEAAYAGISLAGELERVAEALELHGGGEEQAAVEVLEAVESRQLLVTQLPSAGFYWLLGVCRLNCGDAGGAAVALHRALDLEPGHPAVLEALEKL